MGAKYDYYLLKDSKHGAAKESELTGKVAAEGPFKTATCAKASSTSARRT